MLIYLLKHYLELYITDNALKVSASLYCLYTTSISHGVEIILPGCGVLGNASLMLFYRFIMIFFQTVTFLAYSWLYV